MMGAGRAARLGGSMGLLWVWLVGSGAAAGEPPVEVADVAVAADRGEYQRLTEEIARLAAKNAWGGVERTFQLLLATGAPLSFEDWLAGAQSARVVGDAAATRQRLEAAKALREDRTVIDWLWSLDTQFGKVSLACDPDSYITLIPKQTPFDPDQMRAVEFARERVRSTCLFDGLLPAGQYEFHTRTLDVRPKVHTIQIDLRGVDLDRRTRRHLRKQWKAETEGEPS